MSTGTQARRSARRTSRTASFAPNQSSSEYDQTEQDYWTDRELSLIENALREHGEMRRRDIGDMLGCRYWGPRRFARALRIGTDEGRFRRVRRGVYGPAEGGQ
jgi:hypothetical protein